MAYCKFSPKRSTAGRRFSPRGAIVGWLVRSTTSKVISFASPVSKRQKAEWLCFVGIGVLFGCFGRKIDGPRLPGGLIIYQGHPSISPKRTPMFVGCCEKFGPMGPLLFVGMSAVRGILGAETCGLLQAQRGHLAGGACARGGETTLFESGLLKRYMLQPVETWLFPPK